MAIRPIARRRALAAVIALLSSVSLICVAQRSTATSSAPNQKYKGIFEPVNYPDDVSFNDVFFVNDQVGWVSGRGSGGTILHTVDGGQHWNIQLGDPKSNEPEIKHLRFLDATHGWALQAGKLLRTTDGQNWQVIGSYQDPYAQYRFTTASDGFEAFGYYTGSTIAATHDGGRTWHDVFKCATSLQVKGLTTNVSCMIFDMHFPSVRVGYGVGGSFNDGFLAIAKTEDGGATWKIIFATTDLNTANAVFFQDENHGIVRINGGPTIITADGGRTWQGATGSPVPNFRFADPTVGWACGGISCSVSVDGGQHWVSHDIPLPTTIANFSLPRRDRAYVVGDHGMIYHYRIVPAAYAAKGIVDAPLVPAYGGSILGHLDHMRSQVGALQAKLSSAGSAGGSASAGNSASTPAPAAANSSGNTYSQDSTSAPGAAGAFSQDSTSTPGAAGAFSQDSTSAQATNFSQDTSVAPSSAIQSCCAAQVQDLQNSVGLLGQQVPSFSGEFRNLNLLFVGLNMFSDLVNKAQAINQSFMTLKQAPNLPAALAALQTLSSQIGSTSQAIDSEFQNLSSGNATSGSSFGNMTNGAAQDNGTVNPPPSPSPNPNPIPNPVGDAAQKAKDILNKVIHF
jgi:photosystem II stability/assembly factor-like uncharacterized protein